MKNLKIVKSDNYTFPTFPKDPTHDNRRARYIFTKDQWRFMCDDKYVIAKRELERLYEQTFNTSFGEVVLETALPSEFAPSELENNRVL